MLDALLVAEVRVHIVAIAVYALASAFAITGQLLRRRRLSDWSRWAVLVGIILHTAALGMRWVGSGHGPYVTKYEMLSTYALAMVVLQVVLSWRSDRLRRLGVVIYPLTFLMIALGLYTGPEVRELPPTFSGMWLVLHVCFYVAAFATAMVALSSAVMLLREQNPAAVTSAAERRRVDFDSVAYRYSGLAFAFWGIGMLTGSIWAYYSWGRFWGWDPVETWSLVTWIFLGVYLHTRRFYRWKGRKAAILLVVCVALAMFSLFGTSLLSDSLHAVYFQ